MAQPVVPLVPRTMTTAAMAEAIEAGFQAAAAQAIQEAHNAGLSVPVLGMVDKVAWLPPDNALAKRA